MVIPYGKWIWLGTIIIMTGSKTAFATEANYIDFKEDSETVSRSIEELKSLNSNNTFKVGSQHLLDDSKEAIVQRYKLTQYYKDIPVLNTAIAVNTDTVEEITLSEKPRGNYFTDIELDIPSIEPIINKRTALQKIKAIHGITDERVMVNPQTNLAIKVYTKVAKLIYIIEFFSTNPQPSRPFYILDANSGEILERWDGLTTDYTTAIGPGGNVKIGKYYYDETNPLIVNKVDEICTMDSPNVVTYDNQNSNDDTKGKGHQFACPKNTYKSINGAYSPINDAHNFGNVVHNMFSSWIKTPPLRNKIKLIVHYGKNYANAFWNGTHSVFGDGSTTTYPFVTPDVIAHEIGHGFTEQNSSLRYQNQSGAINESFSDITGEATRYFNL